MPFHNGLTRAQGDPGFFSFLGKVAGTVLRAVPGPVGAIAGAILPPKATKKAPVPIVPFQQQRGAPILRPTPGIAGTFQRAIPGGATGFEVDPATGQLCPKRRRRRIDPLNMKALRRANTRQRSFLRAVDRTLKTMPTKGQVSKRRAQIRGAK